MNQPLLRVSRGLAAMRLAARGGARYAANAPRLFARAGEQRQRLRDDLALRTAQDVADTLGTMKGVLMKIGQLASYVDDGLAPPARANSRGALAAYRAPPRAASRIAASPRLTRSSG